MEEFLTKHADAIGTLLGALVLALPSLFTGLTRYQKVITVVWRAFVARLSVVQPKDSFGTFKAPLAEPAPPPQPGTIVTPAMPPVDGEEKTDPAVKIIAFLLPFFGAVTFMVGCCKGPDCKPGSVSLVDTAIDCTKDVVKSRGPQLFPIVADLLGFGTDWRSELNALGSTLGQYGAETVYCVVQRVLEENSKMMATSGEPVDGRDAYKMRNILERSPEYLEGKRFAE